MSRTIGAGFILSWGCAANVEQLPAIRGTAAALRMSGKKKEEHPTLQKWKRRSTAEH